MENNYLWFTVMTITNYEQKIAKDLRAIRDNLNLSEIKEIIVPMETYETPTGKKKERSRFSTYFFAKLAVDNNNQPPTWLWHKIRNIRGCVGILQRNGFMIGMDDFELKESLNITDEDIASMEITNLS